MVETLDSMASRGKAKMTEKAARMAEEYEAAKTDMKAHYSDTPFGPRRKAAYNAAIDAARHRVDPDKWERNWKAKMSR